MEAGKVIKVALVLGGGSLVGKIIRKTPIFPLTFPLETALTL